MSCMLALTLAIGATLAYLNKVTDPKVNKMSFYGGKPTDNLDAELLEPEWDKENPNGALNLFPGAVVKKDPQIKNTSTATSTTLAVDEWVAIKVSYDVLKADGTVDRAMTEAEVAKLLKLIAINYNTTAWEKDPSFTSANANGVVYYYRTALVKGATTTPLFTTVTVDKNAVKADIEAIMGAPPVGFAPFGIGITVKGAAVQTEHLTYALAKPELLALCNKP